MSGVIITPKTVEMVVKLFGVLESYEKVAAWLNTPNLNLGGASPKQLINTGRSKPVIEFIDAALARQREL